MSASSLVTDIAIVTPTYALVPSADTLAAAFNAVTATGDASATASATLASVTLARYAFHAAKYSQVVQGMTVLSSNKAKEVSMLLWLDATGTLTPPAAKERKGAEVSFANYVSRYGIVAQSFDYGTAGLESVESAASCLKMIREESAAAKAKENDVLAALQAIADSKAFGEWLSAQPQALQTAFAHVATALRGNAAPHLPAFVASVTTSPADRF